jgi:nicotinate-nucleotide adenylyltransferase
VSRIGAYPGSFNPLTVAHLAIAESALLQCELDRVDFVVSRIALAKEEVERPRLADRVEVLRRAARSRPWMSVVVSEKQLLAEIGQGYDVLILGADKWAQVCDPGFYGGSPEERDAALSRLPRLAVAPRPPFPVPEGDVLDISPELRTVSSSAVRSGKWEWMAAEARELDGESGAWSDPALYETWLQRTAE